jgi:hypothetical protein
MVERVTSINWIVTRLPVRLQPVWKGVERVPSVTEKYKDLCSFNILVQVKVPTIPAGVQPRSPSRPLPRIQTNVE